jgi:ribonuclease HI
LYLYLAVSPTAISATLIREDEGIQKLVYFVSKALHGAKLDLSGRLANWAIELGQFDLEFVPRNAIKGQALADFLVEFTNMPEIEEPNMDQKWVVYVDGSSTKKKGGVGIVLVTPEGEELNGSLRLEFRTTNNEAEYETVIVGLGFALELGADSVEVRSDSQVIVGHVRGEFEAKGEKMKKYLAKVQSMQTSFQKFCIKKIPREDNEKADHLARMVSTENTDYDENKKGIRILRHSSIFEEASDVSRISSIEEVSDWRKEIISYLQNGILPSEKKSAT